MLGYVRILWLNLLWCLIAIGASRRSNCGALVSPSQFFRSGGGQWNHSTNPEAPHFLASWSWSHIHYQSPLNHKKSSEAATNGPLNTSSSLGLPHHMKIWRPSQRTSGSWVATAASSWKKRTWNQNHFETSSFNVDFIDFIGCTHRVPPHTFNVQLRSTHWVSGEPGSSDIFFFLERLRHC